MLSLRSSRVRTVVTVLFALSVLFPHRAAAQSLGGGLFGGGGGLPTTGGTMTGDIISRNIYPSAANTYVLGNAGSGQEYYSVGTRILQLGDSGASVYLRRGSAANVLRQSNSTNAQTFEIYNTTDSDAAPTTYTRGILGWDGNGFKIGAELASGTANLSVIPSGTLYLGGAGTAQLIVDQSGHFSSLTDDARNLGAGANRWRSLTVSKSIGGGTVKALTETTATGFVKVAIPSNTSLSGVIRYEIAANDAADFQNRSGLIPWSAVNKAGVITSTLGTVAASTEVVAVSLGTLTNTFTMTQASNELTFLANATSSLTQTTLQITYWVELNSGARTTATVTGL